MTLLTTSDNIGMILLTESKITGKRSAARSANGGINSSMNSEATGPSCSPIA